MYHGFDIDVAKEYGVDQAIMISNFQHWIILNARNKKNFHEGRYWTYNSYKALSSIHPYWTEKQVRRILASLLELGILVDGKFNEKDYDNTKWYAFSDEAKWIGEDKITPSAHTGIGSAQTGTSSPAHSGTPSAHTGTTPPAQTGRPIPDRKQERADIKPNKKKRVASASLDASENFEKVDSGENTEQVPPIAQSPQDENVEDVAGDKLPSGLYAKMMRSYFDWYIEKVTTGIEPKIDKGEGKAMKELVRYFYTVIKKRKDHTHEICTHEDICDGAAHAFSTVLNALNKESKIDAFLKAGKTLKQINSNLNNILDQMRNGNPKTQQQSGFANQTSPTEHNRGVLEELARRRKQTASEA